MQGYFEMVKASPCSVTTSGAKWLLPLDRLEQRLEVATRWIGTKTLAEALGPSRYHGTKTLSRVI